MRIAAPPVHSPHEHGQQRSRRLLRKHLQSQQSSLERIRRRGRRALHSGSHLVCLFSLASVSLLPGARNAAADAIVSTRAMSASTIAEYFIEPGRVRLELEIGLGDLETFRNLLPDEIYERLGHAPRPLAERLGEFFRDDFAISAEQGAPLSGSVREIGPRTRVRRDEISGEPQADEAAEPEAVVFARIDYPLPDEPRTLTLRGPSRAATSVGFVAYHREIPVNDFRYLTHSQTLELDWGDPWYTSFDVRALRRRYFAPMSGFLYVEPYEVRKEVIVRPFDLQQWVDLGLEGRETIPVEMQPALKRAAAEFLRGHHPVSIDGKHIEPELARVNFLARSLRTSRVIDPAVELDVHAAVLGVIFVYPTSGLPERVTLEWDLWTERAPRIPVSAVDEAGGLPSFLEPDWRVLEWRNFLKNPTLPTLAVVAPPPGGWTRALPAVAGLLLAASLVQGFRTLYRARRIGRLRAAGITSAALGLIAAAAVFGLGQSTRPTDEVATEIVGALLHNVYRAFDYRDEGHIYDLLAQSAQGELLTQIYLETRKGLELASQGGARARVNELEILELDAETVSDGAFEAAVTWSVGGSVGHWGHLHQRRNRYRANLTVAPVDGAWKLTGLDILEEERL
jgi:hypothetical protein